MESTGTHFAMSKCSCWLTLLPLCSIGLGCERCKKFLRRWAIQENRIAVLGELLAGIAQNDPEGAFDLAMQVNGLDREIVERVIRVWAEIAPLNALTAATESGEARVGCRGQL